MKYNFDEVVDRRGTSATKVERMPKGSAEDALALWVADMDFSLCRAHYKGTPRKN